MSALLDGLRSGAWLDRQTFAPLRYAVPGVVPEGFTLLIGPPKIGKSWWVLDAALAVAAGGVAWGALRVPQPEPVLYLALEDGDRRMQDRCRRLLDRAAIPPLFSYMTTVRAGSVVETVEEWLDASDGDSCPLVVLDTLGRVMPPAAPGESAYQRDYRIGARLKRIVDDRPGVALVVNHHDRKAASDDFVDTVSGTHGLAGSADTILALVRRRQDRDGILKVTGRDVPEAEYAMAFVGGCAWTVADGDLTRAAERASTVRATEHLSDRSTEVYGYVAGAGRPVRAMEVEQALDLPDARRYLARMAETGRLNRVGRGLYTPVPTVPMHNPSTTTTTHTGQRDSGDTHIESTP